MNVVTAMDKGRGDAAGESRARVGLIIPSVNTFTELQFGRFAPAGLGFHVTRARIAGEWKRPLPEMAAEIATSAKLLSDCHPDLIVFHCTDTSMTQGPQGEAEILDIVRDATGLEAMATSRLVLEALQRLGMKSVVLLTPYKSNKTVIDYLNASGIGVVRDVAMGLEGRHFGEVTPRQWTALAKQNDGPDADGIFLSCTNTTQIEAIADIEALLGKPVVNSNQAVLWGCVKKLQGRLPPLGPMPRLGRLMQNFG
jgi:maleate isomerase